MTRCRYTSIAISKNDFHPAGSRGEVDGKRAGVKYEIRKLTKSTKYEKRVRKTKSNEKYQM